MFRQMSLAGASLLALALLQPIGAGAASTTITAGGNPNSTDAKDATIYQNNPNHSNGAGPGLFAGKNSGGSIRRGLIWFDVVGRDAALYNAIKNAASIDAVTVYMDIGMTAGSGGGDGGGGGTCPGGDDDPRTIKLQRITTGMWGEGTTGSSATQIGGTGQGFTPPGTGDATWNAYQHNPSPPPANSWSTPGGDFSGTVSASNSTVTNNCPHTYSWTDANLITDVKAWLGIGTPAPNYGWIVIGDEVNNTSFRAFYTKDGEALSLGSGPRLEITYTP